MRKACLTTLYQLAKQDKRIVFIGSDLGAGTLADFRRDFPTRFFMEGISEGHIIGMAAGLAMNGYIPYVNTIATFLTRRCLEQIIVDVAMHNLPVRLIGSGGGFVYAPLGPTHLAVDDIALMRSVSNMGIIAPADASEMERLLPLTVDFPHPLYLRLAKGGDPIVSPQDVSYTIGTGVVIREGGPILLVTTGITLSLAQEAARILQQQGISCSIVHFHTIAPFDAVTIRTYARSAALVVTIEEGIRSGGLGSCVAEVIAEEPALFSVQVLRIGSPTGYCDSYGSQRELMIQYGITSEAIIALVRSHYR